MVRKYKKHSGCKVSAKVVGSHVTVKATCPIKEKGTKAYVPVKKKVVKRKHVTKVPAACKGLKKKARKACAKKVCAQRPAEYREACYKAAGIR